MQVEKGIKSKALAKEPKLYADVAWVWQGFHFLSGRRSYGMGGPLPITTQEIESYLRLKNITRDDDVDFFLRMLPQLDDGWLETDYKRREQNREKTKNKDQRR